MFLYVYIHTYVHLSGCVHMCVSLCFSVLVFYCHIGLSLSCMQRPPVSPQPGAGNSLEVKPVGNGTLNKQQQPPPLPSREETNDEYQPFSL